MNDSYTYEHRHKDLIKVAVQPIQRLLHRQTPEVDLGARTSFLTL